FEFPDAADRQDQQDAEDQLGRRDRQRYGADARGPDRASGADRGRSHLDMDTASEIAGHLPFVFGLTVFALACFVGYYVVWRVTPALHSPLMSVTNAISSVIIVGALIAAGPAHLNFAQVMGFIAVTLASVNIDRKSTRLNSS